MRHTKEKKSKTEFWWGNMEEIHHLGETGTDARITLKWILKKQNCRAWTEFIWLGMDKNGGHL